MPIIYSVVARGTIILAEFSTAKGNFAQVTRRILEKIPTGSSSKMSYVYDRHIFHYMVEDSITFLCMADEQFGRRLPFLFLEDLRTQFKASYGDRGKNALAYGMNEDFSRVMQNKMDFYSNNPNADKISKVGREIDEVKTVMVQNIEKMLDRGERIELLVDKTETLSSNAFKFKKSSTSLKRAMWCKNMKLTVLLVLIGLVVVYFIIVAACGGFTLDKCVHKSAASGTVANLAFTLLMVAAASHLPIGI